MAAAAPSPLPPLDAPAAAPTREPHSAQHGVAFLARRIFTGDEPLLIDGVGASGADAMLVLVHAWKAQLLRVAADGSAAGAAAAPLVVHEIQLPAMCSAACVLRGSGAISADGLGDTVLAVVGACLMRMRVDARGARLVAGPPLRLLADKDAAVPGLATLAPLSPTSAALLWRCNHLLVLSVPPNGGAVTCLKLVDLPLPARSVVPRCHEAAAPADSDSSRRSVAHVALVSALGHNLVPLHVDVDEAHFESLPLRLADTSSSSSSSSSPPSAAVRTSFKADQRGGIALNDTFVRACQLGRVLIVCTAKAVHSLKWDSPLDLAVAATLPLASLWGADAWLPALLAPCPDGRHVLLLGDQGRAAAIAVDAATGGLVSLSPLATPAPLPEPWVATFAFEDYVYIGGALADGGLYVIDWADAQMQLDTSIPSLFPVHDFDIADLHGDGQQSMLVGTGHHAHGSLRIVTQSLAVVEHERSEAGAFDGVANAWSVSVQQSGTGLAAPSQTPAGLQHLLVLSFVTDTRLMLQGEALADVSDDWGITQTEATLFAHAHDHWLVQVTATQVLICDGPRPVARWNPPGGQHVTLGHAVGPWLVVADTGLRVHALRIRRGEFSDECELIETGSAELTSELSSLLLVHSPATAQHLLFVGTFSPSVEAFQLVASGSLTAVGSFALETSDLRDTRIPHSLAALFAPDNALHLLAGLRDGMLCDLLVASDVPERVEMHMASPLRRLGNSPVGLVSVSAGTLALCDRSWLVQLPARHVQLTLLAVTTLITCVAPTPGIAPADSFALIGSGQLAISTIDMASRVDIRTIPMGMAPRRVLYHRASRSLVVYLYHGPSAPGKLVAIDPLETPSAEELCAMQPSAGLECSRGTSVVCLQEWRDSPFGDVVLAGRSIRETSGDLVVIRVDRRGERNAPATRALLCQTLNSPVVALALCSDGVLVSAGSEVLLLSFPSANESPFIVARLRCIDPIRSLSACNHLFCVGTTCEPLTFYSIDMRARPSPFLAREGERHMRSVQRQLMLDESTVLSSDMDGNLFATIYSDTGEIGTLTSARTLFPSCSANVGDVVVRMRMGSMAYRGSDADAPSQIIVCTLSGTIIVLSEIKPRTAARLQRLTRRADDDACAPQPLQPLAAGVVRALGPSGAALAEAGETFVVDEMLPESVPHDDELDALLVRARVALSTGSSLVV